MKKIAIVDTSDFDTYPVGGQLTSIRSFIKYIGLAHQDEIELILIGITRKSEEVDQKIYRHIGGSQQLFIPIFCDTNDPNNPQHSLRKSFMRALFQHHRMIKKLEVDLVYIHTPEAFFPIRLATFKPKIVTFSHGNFYHVFDNIRFSKYKNSFIKFLVNRYITFVIRFSSHVFVLDSPSYRSYKRYNKHVTKVFNSIDLDQFDRRQPIKTEAIQALYVGRLSQNKNIDKIILAFKGLPKQHQLKVIGNGELQESLKQLIQDNQLEDQVQLLGKKTQEELQRYYQEANILVINSDTEGVPMVLLEALASGLCIVSTPVGGIPETIKDLLNGRFTNGTSLDIQDKMLEVLDHIEEVSSTNLQLAHQFRYQTVNKEICDTLFYWDKHEVHV